MPTLRLAAVSLVLLTATACGGDGNEGDAIKPGTSNSPSAGAGSGEPVQIKGTEALTFDPDTFEVKKGDKVTVELSIQGSIPHNLKLEAFGVKEGDTLVSSADAPKTFSFTADKTGAFEYECTIHPGMKGTLTVA